MSAPPKDKSAARPAPARAAASARADRTSSVVTATIIGLGLIGVATIFWEPLAALALGSPADEAGEDSRGGPATEPGGSSTARDAGAGTTDASGNS